MSDGPRRLRITGIHHVTLIAADLDRTVRFYRDVLGMRLVEQGHNDDDPNARHFWFGDENASPGTIVSFFEYPALAAGRTGPGTAHHLALAVESDDELEGWREWLESQGVGTTEVLDRRFFRSIYLRDPDGHILELASTGPGFPPGPA